MSINTGLLGDRIKDTASSVTGSLVNLSNSAPAGFQAFGTFYANADVCPCYVITDGTNWEVSYGAYTTGSPNTLARAATPIASSNLSGGLPIQVVSFSGTISVFCTSSAAVFNGTVFATNTGRIYPRFKSSTNTGTAASKAVGTVRYFPIFIPQWFAACTLYANLNAAFAGTATFSMGLYENVNGQPGARLCQTTGINCGTGATTDGSSPNTGSMTLSSPQPPGWYWVAWVGTTNATTWNIDAMAAGSVASPASQFGMASIAKSEWTTMARGYTETSATLPATATPATLIVAADMIVGAQVTI